MDNHTMAEEKSLFSHVTPRQVMEDLAEWWVRVILNDTNVRRFECLEPVIAYVSPLNARSDLADQLRILSLWQDALINSHLQGDFSKLQDKFMLLGAKYVASENEKYQECLQLLNVHEKLGRFFAALSSSGEASQRGLVDVLKNDLQVIYHGEEPPQELLNFLDAAESSNKDPTVIRQNLEALVGSNAEDSVTSYRHLRKQVQAVLLNWVETEFETPLLVQLGYRMPPSTVTRQHGLPVIQEEQTKAGKTHGRHQPLDSDATAEKTDSEDETSPHVTGGKRASENPAVATAQEDADSDATEVVAKATQTSAPAPSAASSKETLKQNNLDFGDDDEEEEVLQAAIAARRKRVRKILSVSPQSRRRRTRSPEESAPKRRRRHQQQSEENESPNAGTERQQRSSTPRSAQQQSGSRRRRSVTTPAEQLLASLIEKVGSAGSNHSQGRRTGATAATTSPEVEQVLRRQLDHLHARELERLRLAALGLQRRASPATTVGPSARTRAAAAAADARKRKPFSGKESMAVVEGVRRYGDDWVKIKTHFASILGSRSLISIKDRARVLMKKGKLSPADLQPRRGQQQQQQEDGGDDDTDGVQDGSVSV